MARRPGSLLLPILVLLAGCGGDETRDAGELTLPPEVDQAIDSAYARFSRAYELKDAGLVAGLYTLDALYLPPEGDVLRGRPAIRASFESFFQAAAQQQVDARIGFSSVERRGDAGLVYDVGYYTLRFGSGGQTFATSRGKFTTVWKPGADGRWRIHVDTFNGAAPPEQPADTAAADSTAGAGTGSGGTGPGGAGPGGTGGSGGP